MLYRAVMPVADVSGAKFQTGRLPTALRGSGVQPCECSLFQRGNDTPGLFEIRLSLQINSFLEHQKMQSEEEEKEE